MNKHFYTTQEVCDLLGICQATLYNRMKRGALPEPLKLNSRLNLWPKKDFDKWLKTNSNM